MGDSQMTYYSPEQEAADIVRHYGLYLPYLWPEDLAATLARSIRKGLETLPLGGWLRDYQERTARQ